MTGVLKRWFVWAVLAGAVLLAGGLAQAAERRVALVIGNAQYQRGGALPAVAANAAAVAEALRTAGFDVTVASNQEHRGLVAALSHFATKAKGAELGVVYYSGLALSLGGKSFVVPVDAKLASEYDVVIDTVELDQLLQQMQSPQRGVVLLDAVTPNPLADTLAQAMGKAGRSVRPVPGAPGPADTLLIAYSHQPDTAPAPVQGSGPSPFAAALAQELVKPGADVRGALAAVERTVAARTNGAQRPWMQDRLGQTVALLPVTVAPPPAAPPPATPLFAEKHPEPPPAAAPEPKVEPLEGSFVTTRDTNMRQGPDIKAPVLRTVARETTVTATGQVRRGSWIRTTLDGQQGFISSGNLRRSDASAEPPPDTVAAAPPGPTAAPAEPAERRMLRSATLFDRPALGARGVRELPAGMPVTVVEAVPGSNWVRVRDRSSQEGYVTIGALTAGGEPPPPDRAPTAVVNRDEALALSGSSRWPETAAVPPDRGISGPAQPSPAQGAVQDAVRSARDSAAAGESAATQARASAQRAAEAQRFARDAAETARAGTPRAWVHRFANGDAYEGEWAMVSGDGMRQVHKSGHGVYRFADGQVYEGEWRDDQMAGVGVLTFRTGDRYAGTFRGGRPEGLGMFRYANGDGYAGEVHQNRPEGPGELTYANGDRYQGRVADRRPSGYGALTMNGTGGRHLGRFRDGVPDGPGVGIAVDGTQHGGVWQGNHMAGE
ncbi:caspase family protein [Azospirillum sp. sgz301742]